MFNRNYKPYRLVFLSHLKHIETDVYVLIDPEMQKKIITPNFAGVLYNSVQYGTVQYTRLSQGEH